MCVVFGRRTGGRAVSASGRDRPERLTAAGIAARLSSGRGRSLRPPLVELTMDSDAADRVLVRGDGLLQRSRLEEVVDEGVGLL